MGGSLVGRQVTMFLTRFKHGHPITYTWEIVRITLPDGEPLVLETLSDPKLALARCKELEAAYREVQ